MLEFWVILLGTPELWCSRSPGKGDGAGNTAQEVCVICWVKVVLSLYLVYILDESRRLNSNRTYPYGEQSLKQWVTESASGTWKKLLWCKIWFDVRKNGSCSWSPWKRLYLHFNAVIETERSRWMESKSLLENSKRKPETLSTWANFSFFRDQLKLMNYDHSYK